MYFATASESIIINKIEDILFIELKDNIGKDAEYSIQTENDKVIRRGRFKGSLTQLCLTHLASGCYKLFLSRDDADMFTYKFEKHSNNFFPFGS